MTNTPNVKRQEAVKELDVNQLKIDLPILLSSVYITLSSSEILQLCDELLQAMPSQSETSEFHCWDESTAMLITYGDSISNTREAPLHTLKRFLKNHIQDAISCVHILPFYPFTSDDGFSVIDYNQVNPKLGQWHDIESLSKDYDIMFDAVVNHISSESEWFREYVTSQTDDNLFFQEIDLNTDLSQVTRPRTTPLLKAVETARGLRHVWCTFSHDQVDLNYANPKVLVAIVKVLQQYLDRGARWFRLDAVAFIWKKLDSTCINLPEVHQLIRVVRLLLERANPKAVIVTETNVPFAENVAYFGAGDEAHIIYNFSLPPLLLQGLLSQNSKVLQEWIASLPETQEGTTYLNFVASHDGIGLRPAEGLLNDEQLEEMKAHIKSRGGFTTDRQLSDGTVKTYEMNISLFDALGSTFLGEDEYQVPRFIAAYAITLALAGVPAIYIHSFLATANDTERYKRTGVNRALNRHEWCEDTLQKLLEDSESVHSLVLSQLRSLLISRKQCAAFHPNAKQRVLDLPSTLLGIERRSQSTEETDIKQTVIFEKITAIYNMTKYSQVVSHGLTGRDLLTGLQYNGSSFELKPYEFVWLSQ